MGFVNMLIGVVILGVVGVINVLFMVIVCWVVFLLVLDVVIVDGVNMWLKICYIVWFNIKGMVFVVVVFLFIGVWDDFLWLLVVFNDLDKYMLIVGM